MRILSYILLSSVFFVSCWSNPRPKTSSDDVVLEDALRDQTQARFNAEFEILDSLSTSWGWSPDTLVGGVLLQKVVDKNQTANAVDDDVELRVKVSLANGNHCFTNDSLRFSIGHFDGPKVFEEVAKHISPGDSVVALVPSEMGFGVRGYPGLVPPGAMLLIEISQPIR